MLTLDLFVERMESKRMLSGNVSVRVAGGDLIVNGDSENNVIVIRANPTPGEFTIQGIGSTTVENANAITVDGVLDDARINLRGGSNFLLLTSRGTDQNCHPMSLDDVRIQSGNGDDTVAVDDATVEGNLQILTRGGNDVVLTNSTSVAGRLSIRTAAGDDTSRIVGSSSGRKASINLATGDDAFSVDSSFFQQELTLRTVSGRSFVGLVATTVNEDYTFIRNGSYFEVLSQFSVVGDRNDRGNASGSVFVIADTNAARNRVQIELSNQPRFQQANQFLAAYGC